MNALLLVNAFADTAPAVSHIEVSSDVVTYLSPAGLALCRFELQKGALGVLSAARVRIDGADGAVPHVYESGEAVGVACGMGSWARLIIHGPSLVGVTFFGHPGTVGGAAFVTETLVGDVAPLAGRKRVQVEQLTAGAGGYHAARRRRAQLVSSAPPHGRLSGCPEATVGLSLGVVVDYGFVLGRGGVDGALVAAAWALEQTRALFEDQLGVRLRVEQLLLNAEPSDNISATGPNQAPSAAGERSCPDYAPRVVAGHGVDVFLSGPSIALNRLAQWVGSDAPAELGAWLLLTNCFPPNGTVGLAPIGAVCSAGSTEVTYADTGIPPEPGDDCIVATQTGNCAEMRSAAELGACEPGDLACLASTAVASDSRNLWKTVAHELGHDLGAVHTFAEGGIMAYSGEGVFYDNGDVCPHIASVLASPTNCLSPLNPVCGNGRVELGEQCDDGGLAAGDGCDPSCTVECGWLCSEPLTASGFGVSACSLGCGNGVVDVSLGEECDSSEACCVGCRLAPGYDCCGGECCTEAGAFATTVTTCADGAGACVAGDCVSELSFCRLYTNTATALGRCPILPTAACRPQCGVFSESVAGYDYAGSPVAGSGAASGIFEGCFGPEAYDPAVPSSALADGAACVTVDGVAEGVCEAGECIAQASPSSSCGNGAVEPGEQCDDSSPCCDSDCTLAAYARCSGDCCPDCAPGPALLGGSECARAGGLCIDGRCLSDGAAIGANGKTLLSGGSCESPLLKVERRARRSQKEPLLSLSTP